MEKIIRRNKHEDLDSEEGTNVRFGDFSDNFYFVQLKNSVSQ